MAWKHVLFYNTCADGGHARAVAGLEALVSHRLRIGSRIGSADPFWVQVRESVRQKAQQLTIDLVSIDIGHSSRFSKEEHAELVDELLAQDLDALISTCLPDDLAYRILDFGLPVIHLTETDVRHPLFVA